MLNAFIFFLMTTSAVFAQVPELAVGGGFIFNRPDIKSAKSDGVSIHEEDTVTLNIGARVLVPMEDKFKLRTGLYLQEKSAKLSAESGSVSIDSKARILELAIPLNVQYQLHENFSVFGGYVMDLPINEYCEFGGNAGLEGCSVGESAKVTHNLNLGGSVSVHEKIDLDFSYQHPMKAVLNDVKIYAWVLQVFYKL